MIFSMFENPVLIAISAVGFIFIFAGIFFKKISFVFNIIFALCVVVFLFFSFYFSVPAIQILIIISIYFLTFFLAHSTGE